MTDLERVRDALLFSERNLGRLGNGTMNPSEDKDLWKTPHEALAIINAHLKEDAEAKESRLLLIQHIQELEAELAELRELLYRATAPTASLQEAEDREAAIREGHERTKP